MEVRDRRGKGELRNDRTLPWAGEGTVRWSLEGIMGLGKVWRPEEGEAVWEGGQVERWCEEDSRLQRMAGLVGAQEIPTVLGRVPEF